MITNNQKNLEELNSQYETFIKLFEKFVASIQSNAELTLTSNLVLNSRDKDRLPGYFDFFFAGNEYRFHFEADLSLNQRPSAKLIFSKRPDRFEDSYHPVLDFKWDELGNVSKQWNSSSEGADILRHCVIAHLSAPQNPKAQTDGKKKASIAWS